MQPTRKMENPLLTVEEVSIASPGNAVNNKLDRTSNSCEKRDEEPKNAKSADSDSFNGGSCESYSWSQSILDLDVLVRLPSEVRSSKQLRVLVESDKVDVAVLSPDDDQKQITLVKGRLSFKIKSCESYWCLEPGKHLSLHLEKTQDRWWESLFDDEPRIELSKIDCSRKLDDLSESEQMKLEELMWIQKQKSLGHNAIKPPRYQPKLLSNAS